MRKLTGILFLLFYFFSVVAFIAPTFAQTTPTRNEDGFTNCDLIPSSDGKNACIQAQKGYIKPIQRYVEGVKSENGNNASFVNNTAYNTVSATTVLLVGVQDAEYNKKVNDPSALQSLSTGMAMLYTPPAGTQEYIADLMRDSGFNIVQPAYAQGLGFSALSPILTTWKVFRNIAYFFYVLLFLIIGFMIMLRQKIGNQTAVGIQQALPNIVVSLLAVTFSYAIAGLLIDIMYLMMFFIVSVFQPYFISSDKFNLQNFALNDNIFGVGYRLLTNTNSLETAFGSISQLVKKATESGGIGADLLGGVGGFIAGLTFALVFAIALVFQIFRLFIELLKTYISIIISIVLSPIALMLGALPGNNAFSSWVKTLVANLAIFPVILIMIIISFMLTSNGLKPEYANTNELARSGTGGFLPPYLTGAGSAAAVQALLGLGMILLLPDIVTQVKKSLGGSGGIFEQFANNFTSALDKGWKGGELIPGVGMTNTNLAGISGNNLFNKAFFGTKESNERADKKKFAIAPRGAMGFGADVYKRTMSRDTIRRLSQEPDVPAPASLGGGAPPMPQATDPAANKRGTVQGLE
jgi:hypothetical protein